MKHLLVILVLTIQSSWALGEEYVCSNSANGITETNRFKRVDGGFVGYHMSKLASSSDIDLRTVEYRQEKTSDLLGGNYVIENVYNIGFLGHTTGRLLIYLIDLSTLNYTVKLLFAGEKKSVRSDGTVVDHNEFYQTGTCVKKD